MNQELNQVSQDEQEKVYEEKVAPLITQLHEACIENRVPCLISVGVKKLEDGSDQLSTSWHRGGEEAPAVLALVMGILTKKIGYMEAGMALMVLDG